ncbi:acyltransferase [Reinekea sp.]|uniref:acyltransferase n=1 Tax=Reinekea sp. TaxID=1970455 RepID=UPI0039895F5F
MRKLLAHLLGVISVITLLVHTLFLGVFLFIGIFFRLILPNALSKRLANPIIVEVSLIWVGGILWWMRHVHRLNVDIEHDIEMSMDQWNLIVSNHQSWLDIFVLFFATYRKLPVLKFFIKSQLFWVPIAGAAWWGMDYPFMSRYSRAYLKKHPEKAGKDLETTKKACEKFSEEPTTVVNFLEGTRFTPSKHKQQSSPYQHLLKPKAGGLAFTIQALGDKFDTLIDATIHYQGKAPSTWDMACGQVGGITLKLRQLDIPKQFSAMDYTNKPADKAEFQKWVADIWAIKDRQLEEIKESSF